MSGSIPSIECELNKGSSGSKNEIFYFRNNIEIDNILVCDLTFFCCYAVRQLVNLDKINPLESYNLSSSLAKYSPSSFHFGNLPMECTNIRDKGERIISHLNLGSELNFKCKAKGFGWRGINKIPFAVHSTIALFEYLVSSNRSMDRTKLFVASANKCRDFHQAGGSIKYGRFIIGNQLNIVAGIVEEAITKVAAE